MAGPDSPVQGPAHAGQGNTQTRPALELTSDFLGHVRIRATPFEPCTQDKKKAPMRGEAHRDFWQKQANGTQLTAVCQM